MIYMYNYRRVGAITVITVPLQIKAGPAFEHFTRFDGVGNSSILNNVFEFPA